MVAYYIIYINRLFKQGYKKMKITKEFLEQLKKDIIEAKKEIQKELNKLDNLRYKKLSEK